MAKAKVDENGHTELGLSIIEGLNELLAWKRGEIELEVVTHEPEPVMPAARIKTIRKKYARSTKAFENRFGIPASTMNNWEQGRRKPDLTARILLKVIEENPEAVERAAKAA